MCYTSKYPKILWPIQWWQRHGRQGRREGHSDVPGGDGSGVHQLWCVIHQNTLKFYGQSNGDNVMAPMDIVTDIVMYLVGMVVEFIKYSVMYSKTLWTDQGFISSKLILLLIIFFGSQTYKLSKLKNGWKLICPTIWCFFSFWWLQHHFFFFFFSILLPMHNNKCVVEVCPIF